MDMCNTTWKTMLASIAFQFIAITLIHGQDTRQRLDHQSDDLVRHLTNQLSEQTVVNQDLRNKIQQIEEDCMRQPPLVSFIATGHGLVSRYNYGDTIIFENEIRNAGNHYSPSNSTFICPYDGLYMFSTSVVSDINIHLLATITIGDAGLASAFGSYVNNPQGSATVMTQCLKGQKVWIQSEVSDRESRQWTSGAKYNYFAGALVHLI